MPIKLDHNRAEEILLSEHKNFEKGLTNNTVANWKYRVDRLSELCPYRKSSTFIAALGTAILAKSVNSKVDVLSILDRDGGPNSYSARSLADNVWAKKRAILKVDLGANGANPLNNTPFIGKARIDEIRNVRNKPGFDYLIECLEFLSSITDPEIARFALRGFIGSRSKIIAADFIVGENAGDYLVVPTLVLLINSLIDKGSEEGRVAQAIAAGLLDTAFSTCTIEVGHVNDPDRNFPLDIVVRDGAADDDGIKFAVEVKDKPVDGASVLSSVEKSLKLGVRDIIFLAAFKKQNANRNFIAEYEMARDKNCRLVVFTNWGEFVKACVSFSEVRSNYFSDAYIRVYPSLAKPF